MCFFDFSFHVFAAFLLSIAHSKFAFLGILIWSKEQIQIYYVFLLLFCCVFFSLFSLWIFRYKMFEKKTVIWLTKQPQCDLKNVLRLFAYIFLHLFVALYFCYCRRFFLRWLCRCCCFLFFSFVIKHGFFAIQLKISIT